MPIIPTIGRRTFKIRAAILFVYCLLIAGSISMIYPFLIMLSGSVKGIADSDRMDPIPQLFHSEAVQFARFQEARYGDLSVISAQYQKDLLKFDQAKIPMQVDAVEVAQFKRFLRQEADQFPEHFYHVAEMYPQGRVLPRNFRKFRDETKKECKTLEGFNRRYGETLSSWNDFSGGFDASLIKEFSYDGSSPVVLLYLRFKRSLPVEEKAIINIDGHYFNTQRTYPEVKSGTVTPNPILSATYPTGAEKVLWSRFVKRNLNCLFVRLDTEGLQLFREYLRRKFPGGILEMNRVNDTAYSDFEAVDASYGEMLNSGFFTLYTDFVTNVCPPKHLKVDTPSTRYRAYVASGTAKIPFIAYDYSIFRSMRKPFLAEIVTRNYLSVLQYIIVYGRSIFNTLIYILLSILAALTVNPIAAYALSRFNLKPTYTILMFFLATMAFPGAVTMIPNFLLLKHLHLLNTFWALILPGLANGYSIFILKGFFDSIPKEVYESAMIDGAGEWTMFWRFTMALSTPILALITLNAFTAAYTTFMFALIICPDEKMWTLMVWLYQMQQGAAQPVIYAALVLAAIPTLIIFILAQNTIMKGIVIPVEK